MLMMGMGRGNRVMRQEGSMIVVMREREGERGRDAREGSGVELWREMGGREYNEGKGEVAYKRERKGKGRDIGWARVTAIQRQWTAGD